jgi:hypothetical protein
VITDERLSGNPQSGGYDSRELADKTPRTFPDSKMLIVVREQTAIIYSSYKQYVIPALRCFDSPWL